MKHFVLIASNWDTSLVTHVGVFPETQIDDALLIAFELSIPFTAFHKEQVKFYDKAQDLRKAMHAGPAEETAVMSNIPIR